MRYFILFFLFIATANAAGPVGSCTVTNSTGVAPLGVLVDCTGITDTLYPIGTGTGYVTNTAGYADGATSITTTTGSGTILTGDLVKFSSTVTVGATSGSNVFTTASTAGYEVGMVVTGTEVPYGAYIYSIQAGVSFTLRVNAGNGNALATNASASITLTDPNIYHVASTTGSPVSNVTLQSPGLIRSIAGVAETITIQPNPHAFADLFYEHNFGDSSGSPISGKTYAYGTAYNNNRNYATGPVVAHVYETPGTYYINTSIRDGTYTLTESPITITVTDPDTVYSTTNTVCASTSGDFTGCPTGATHSTTSDYNTAAALLTANKRLLFRRGETFNVSATITNNNSGTFMGAYGTGAKPIISMAGAYLPIRNNGSKSNAVFMDLNLVSSGSSENAMTFSTTATNIVVLRVDSTGWNNLIIVTPFPTSSLAATGLYVFDSTATSGFSGGTNAGIYCAECSNVAVVGNNINMCSGINSEGIRLQKGTTFYFNHNTITGLVSPACGTLTVRGNTRYGVESDNVMTQVGPWFAPQSGTANEDIRDVIAERNYNTDAPWRIESHYITLRNNVMVTDVTAGILAQILYGTTTGSPMADEVRMYNNTLYSTYASTGVNGINLAAALNTSCNAYFKNNLLWAHSASSPAVITNSGTCTVTGANGTYGNSSTAEMASATSPFNTSPPTTLVDFRTIKSGTANNSTDGAVTLFPAMFDDFLHCKDLTASNFRSGAFVPSANALCSR